MENRFVVDSKLKLKKRSSIRSSKITNGDKPRNKI